MGLDARLRLARLYLCTDARDRQGDLEDFLTAAFAGGVDVVQIRQKGMKPKAELAALEVARHAAAAYQAVVCVNDSAELAGRFSADMLHLGQRDGEASVARRPLHRWALIGRSTHSTEQADQAIADPDVDYFSVGPIFATPSKRPASSGTSSRRSGATTRRWNATASRPQRVPVRAARAVSSPGEPLRRPVQPARSFPRR